MGSTLIRGVGIGTRSLQQEALWIADLEATSPPGLNEHLSFRPFLEGFSSGGCEKEWLIFIPRRSHPEDAPLLSIWFPKISDCLIFGYAAIWFNVFCCTINCIHVLDQGCLYTLLYLSSSNSLPDHDVLWLDLWRPPWTLRCHPIGVPQHT